MEDRIWPSDWLCIECCRPLSKHVKIGAPNEERNGDTSASFNWCFSRSEEGNKAISFLPVDNLTQIEILAKEKAL